MGRKYRLKHNAPRTSQTLSIGKLWPVWSVLAGCIWIAFSPILSNGFVNLDDRDWILENHSFRGLGWEQIRFAFTTFKGGVYQPLGWLAQSLTYEFFGLDPRGYHLVSLFFHVVNVALLHLLSIRLLGRTMPELVERRGLALIWLCAIPVALYAVHPLRVELVAWASPQAYLPSITFSLLATLAYLRGHPAIGVSRISWKIGSSILVAMAVLTKGSAVVLPFFFLILDAYPLGRLGPACPFWPSIRRVLIEKGPILVFCIAFAAVAFVAKQRWGGDPEVTDHPVLIGRAAQAGFGAWFYLVKTALPFGITAFYPRPENEEFRTPVFGVCFIGLVLGLSAALWQRRRCPWLLATLATYLLFLSPYLGLVRVGLPIASDRYSYAPLMAWVVLGCAGLCRLADQRWPRPLLLGGAVCTASIACGSMALCSAQCRVWESSERLWSQALENAQWSPELHRFMGTTLADEGKLDRSLAELREALRLRPHYFEATLGLGVVLDRRGETAAAIPYLREADRLRPKDAKVQLSLGEALARQGNVEGAVALYREALRFQPSYPELHFSLGIALLRQRKIDQAIDELTRAVELRPSYVQVYNILGGAFALSGRLDEAAAQYRIALRLDPDDAASRIDLGLTLARQGESAEAVAQLREAVRRNGRNPEAHHVLAAILVNMGRIREAAAEFEEVLRLRPDDAQARDFLAMARRRRM
jgi:Flp pilus assembly protein TadD